MHHHPRWFPVAGKGVRGGDAWAHRLFPWFCSLGSNGERDEVVRVGEQ